ncbi:hypothetical protein Tco_0793128 [Tanacetum coccineum]
MQRERAAQEEASNAALIAEFDNVQERIEADALLAARLQEKEREQFSIDEQARFLVETIAERKSRKKDDSSSKQAENSKKRPRAEHDEESVKKQKLQDDAEKEELRAYGSSKNYKIFSEMLDDFDRQDVMDLHRLVKERLFDSCGVHVLLMDNGIAIYIMIEKKYPLTQEMLSRMLNRRLEVDYESKMAFELLRFTRSQLKKGGLLGIRAFYNLMLLVQVCAAAED